MIAIIDYGSGNLKSIRNGFHRIGAQALVTNDKRELKKADVMILPGVGAFGTAMGNLKKYEDIIHQHIQEEKPFLGVCLGLQVLFSESEESPGVKGLDVFSGKVVRFPETLPAEGLKIPHMGWNNLNIKRESPLLEGIGSDYMYFVHSYHVHPDNEGVVVATVDYGVEVPAVVAQDNVFATQFHPEKSGEVGLEILKNFLKQAL
ncbi:MULTISPECIES: imidazole glycerol phosphate synthase subunit HisH [Methanobacterium]|jgi:glutamine amidotransferase|uniref:Imidazole glycerol phosphate synthase subunit HisH n=1 Tax=Methanobacterium subterraneum TaxID=59277 RepID=A0A2H4VSB8_9EURY|nr:MULTISPECIES: imidazole glycerol phosphate synthase subunit HisH [Methanobacterium]MBW4256421.1 imidazole glycerol phosphate synthase subunit HisH [Methanobacterium sp. YSL]PKL72949.1 MAG: imidazole glycerol phosphate synthase subunit HisH [Methanobacteriales archaeon HGW-Methanobacteriales-2]AUB55175.1 imidazole glycerol phosphate synthase, glutamine amidotransferase subunit [Methanobacterium subterraneum]AUB57838.1 imidazole glycerol phosphate synthase, glutamine amidotransferase subunit [